ncbi:ATP-binding protein [Streptosporangium soli]|nr:ATP-binding protein [Streptosporangium sp. KLBMP 9127]
MTTPVARRQAATGEPPPGWLLTALVSNANAEIPDLDTRDPASAAVAREFATSLLSEWGAGDLVFDAQVVISELVTNAIRHVGGVVRVRLIRNGVNLACAVTDSSAALPVMSEEEDCFAESGRGLHLVDALCSSWGWIQVNDHGKLVWAVLTR